MNNLVTRFWQWLSHPNPCCMSLDNERVLYVSRDGLAILKCRGCGGESLPWQVSAKLAREWQELNPNRRENK